MRASYLDGIHLPTDQGGTAAKVDEIKIGDDCTTDGYPDRAGAQPVAVDFLSAPNLAEDMFRTIGQSDVAQTPVDPLTTAIVVGKQFRSSGWVDLFFPPTMPLESAASGLARSLSYRYQVWGDSHLDEYDTTLPEGTPWPFSGLDVVWEPFADPWQPLIGDFKEVLEILLGLTFGALGMVPSAATCTTATSTTRSAPGMNSCRFQIDHREWRLDDDPQPQRIVVQHDEVTAGQHAQGAMPSRASSPSAPLVSSQRAPVDCIAPSCKNKLPREGRVNSPYGMLELLEESSRGVVTVDVKVPGLGGLRVWAASDDERNIAVVVPTTKLMVGDPTRASVVSSERGADQSDLVTVGIGLLIGIGVEDDRLGPGFTHFDITSAQRAREKKVRTVVELDTSTFAFLVGQKLIVLGRVRLNEDQLLRLPCLALKVGPDLDGTIGILDGDFFNVSTLVHQLGLETL